MAACVHNAPTIVKAKRTPIPVQIALMDFDDRPEPAKRLQHARSSAGFENARVAATRFGWSYATYSQHERGERGLARSASRYAKAFRVSEAWLLTGEGEASTKPKDKLIQDLLGLLPSHQEAVADLIRALKRAEGR